MLEIVEGELGRLAWEPRQRGRRTWTPLGRALVAAGNPWTLMIVLALSPGKMRLTHLYRSLSGVSMTLLDRYLLQMVALGLVQRTRFSDERPPRVEVELTDAGRELLPIAAALARWGMRYAWSAPLQRERVDIAALLRLLPALLELAELPTGSVEAVVTDTEPPFQRLFQVQDGRLQADEHAPDALLDPRGIAAKAIAAPVNGQATTTIEGDSEAWAAALGGAGEHEQLSIAGDQRLAASLLDALPRSR